MELKLIQIGNSKGVRLPKAVLDELGSFALADLQVKDGSIIITPKHSARQGWDEKFEGFGQDTHERELLMDFANDSDEALTW